jgi:hypothetical protein
MMLNGSPAELAEVTSGTHIDNASEGPAREFAYSEATIGGVKTRVEEWMPGEGTVYVSIAGIEGFTCEGHIAAKDLDAVIESLILTRQKSRAIGFLR